MPYKSLAQAAFFNIHKKELEQKGVKVIIVDVPCPQRGAWMPDVGPGPLPPSFLETYCNGAQAGEVIPLSCIVLRDFRQAALVRSLDPGRQLRLLETPGILERISRQATRRAQNGSVDDARTLGLGGIEPSCRQGVKEKSA